MNSVYLDSTLDDDARRRLLYDGQLFVFSPRPNTLAFAAFAREMIEEAFHPLYPPEAQHQMPVEQFVKVLADLKPKFIHHPRSKQLLQGVLEELGCDLSQTYFDVPRLRSMAHTDYLRSGIALAFHPHRDTWFSAPLCQLNWWLPVYDVQAENVMAFHPRYWSEAVANSSSEYNYYRWNKESRGAAAQNVKAETRKQPQALEPLELDPQVRIITPVGGIVLFSGAQMHSTVPNTSHRTRFSIDFRTVHLDDLLNRRSAPNIDSHCTGTTMRDYLHCTDLSHLPDDVVAMYDDETALSAEGELIYQPQTPGMA
jgi:hypothetical protein